MTPLERLQAAIDRPAWQAQAACRGVDPDLFYPQKNEGGGAPRKVCAACPVRQQCFEFAMERNEKFGIWGGTSRKERRKLRAELREAS